MSEISASDINIVARCASGALVLDIDRFDRAQVDENALVSKCITLHNQGRINLLSLIDTPQFLNLGGHNFFVFQHFLCEAIPLLDSPTDQMLRTVEVLVEKGGNDLAAGRPNDVLRSWLAKDVERAKRVVDMAKTGDECASRSLTFAIEALADIELARTTVAQFSDKRRLSGMSALARLKSPDAMQAEVSAKLLLPYIEAHYDDETRCNALIALFEVCKDFPPLFPKCIPTAVATAIKSGTDTTNFALARTIWLFPKLFDHGSLKAALDSLMGSLRLGERCRQLGRTLSRQRACPIESLESSSSGYRQKNGAREGGGQHVIMLHRIVAGEFLTKKILPHVAQRHALSTAVHSRASVDVNLRLFDVLGRIAMLGLWMIWGSQQKDDTTNGAGQSVIDELVKSGMQCINNNPALFLPIKDDQAIEVALFLMLAAHKRAAHGDIHAWLSQMAQRLDFAVRAHGRYPCSFTDYEDLFDHPKERTDEYRKDATAGSTLIPLLAAWLSAFGDKDALARLIDLKANALAHSTFQLWLPETTSEDHLYLDDDTHGLAICDLPVTQNGDDLMRTIKDACTQSKGFEELSANKTGYWPVTLTACRHYRLPVPPQFWIAMLRPANAPAS